MDSERLKGEKTLGQLEDIEKTAKSSLIVQGLPLEPQGLNVPLDTKDSQYLYKYIFNDLRV